MTRRRLPPLNALRAFESTGRLGRMTAAADELAVTPGAISRQVRQLEENLGVVLFEGSKNKPQLTAAAKILLPALSAAFEQIDTAVRAISDEENGTLDVSCFSTFTAKWLIPRLFHFNVRYPDIEIRLRSTDGAVDPERDRIDITIGTCDEQCEGMSNTSVLFSEYLGPVLAPSLVKAFKLRSLGDLQGKPLLHTKNRSNAWQMWCLASGIDIPIQSGTEFEHYYFTLQAAIGGLGVCIAPWHLVIDDVQAGRLVAPFGFHKSTYQYIVKWRAQRNKKRDLFCAWLLEQAHDMPVPQLIFSK